MKSIEKFLIENKIRYFKDYPLGRLTTFGVGGNAEILVYLNDLKSLKGLIIKIKEFGLPFFILGRGANLLVSDNGFKGIVISLTGEFKKIYFRKDTVFCGAGALISRVSILTILRSFWSFENFLGLPGTIAGGLVMNAGCYGKEISNGLLYLDLLNINGKVKRFKKEEIIFSYRKSIFKENGIILKAAFKLRKGNKEEIIKEALNVLKKRKENIPVGKSAGSIFKNPEDLKARELLLNSGVAGLAIGQAIFSKKHPNIIINNGNAKASDIFNLIKTAKEKVFKKFNVCLEEEIIYVGF